MSAGLPLWRGSVAWADLSPTRGGEQAGRRPVLVVASRGFLETITTLVVVLPVTGVDRGWPNHVQLRGPHGLDRASWAITGGIILRTPSSSRRSDTSRPRTSRPNWPVSWTSTFPRANRTGALWKTKPTPVIVVGGSVAVS